MHTHIFQYLQEIEFTDVFWKSSLYLEGLEHMTYVVIVIWLNHQAIIDLLNIS